MPLSVKHSVADSISIDNPFIHSSLTSPFRRCTRIVRGRSLGRHHWLCQPPRIPQCFPQANPRRYDRKPQARNLFASAFYPYEENQISPFLHQHIALAAVPAIWPSPFKVSRHFTLLLDAASLLDLHSCLDRRSLSSLFPFSVAMGIP